MNQLAIDFAPLSRRGDPITSHKAAERAGVFKSRHIAKIWGALKDIGPMVPKSIADVTGLDYHAVQRRGAEMERKKLITRGPEVIDGMMIWRAT